MSFSDDFHVKYFTHFNCCSTFKENSVTCSLPCLHLIDSNYFVLIFFRVTIILGQMRRPCSATSQVTLFTTFSVFCIIHTLCHCSITLFSFLIFSSFWLLFKCVCYNQSVACTSRRKYNALKSKKTDKRTQQKRYVYARCSESMVNTVLNFFFKCV